MRFQLPKSGRQGFILMVWLIVERLRYVNSIHCIRPIRPITAFFLSFFLTPKRTLSDPSAYRPSKLTKGALHHPTPKYLQKLARKSRATNEQRLSDAYMLDYLEKEDIRVRNDLILELREARLQELQKQKKSRFHGDLYSILVGLLMMDGPFLILRLIMILEFRVTTELHLLFTGKNIVGLSLLLYRLYSLTFGH